MKNYQNPFVYGEIVTGENFTNRQEEKDQLYKNFLSTTNTILISPRRWGKSSLVKEVATSVEMENKAIKVAFLDMYSVFDEQTFYNWSYRYSFRG
jgi:predicted AAA+ superfamily ATPase